MPSPETIRTRFFDEPRPHVEQRLCDGTVVQIEAWPARARRRVHDRWQDYIPTLSLSAVRGGVGGYQQLLDLFDEQLDERETEAAFEMKAWRRFFEEIPEELTGEIVRRYETDHFPVLSFASQCSKLQYALDLMRSNPALAYLLARGRSLNPHLRPDAEQLIRAKQPEALSSVLGRSVSRADVRVVRKVSRDALNLRTATLLLSLLRAQSGPRRWLQHLPSINSAVLEVLSEPSCATHISYTLLFELSRLGVDQRRSRSVVGLLRDTIRQADLLGYLTAGFMLHSIRQVREMHDELAWQTHELRGLRRYRFPKAPFDGSELLVAATTPRGLQEAARRCRNCAAIYAPQIARGTAYIYEVRTPEAGRPGMIRLERRADGWILAEHKACDNRTPSPAAWQAVTEWAALHEISTGRVRGGRPPAQAIEVVVVPTVVEPPEPKQLEAPGVGSLLGLLRDPSTDVVTRRGAALACEHTSWARDEVVPVLLEVLEADPDEQVRKYAARALGTLADGDTQLRIKQVLQGCLSGGLRREVATALYRIETRS